MARIARHDHERNGRADDRRERAPLFDPEPLGGAPALVDGEAAATGDSAGDAGGGLTAVAGACVWEEASWFMSLRLFMA